MRRAAFFILLLAMSCGGGTTCGTDGCGGCTDASYRFPADNPERPDAVVQEDTVRVRITQEFLDFIRPELPELIRQQAGNLGGITIDPNGVVRVPLPDQDLFDIGVAEAQLREAEALVYLDDLDSRLAFNLTPPSGAQLIMSNLRVGVNLKLKQNIIGSTSSCPVTGDLGSDPRHAAEVTVRARLNPGVGPRPDYALDFDLDIDEIDLTDLAVDVLGRSRYCQEPECRDCTVEIFGTCIDPGGRCVECDIFCGGIAQAVASLVSALSDLLRPLLNSILAPVIESLVTDAVDALDGTPVRVETPLDLASLTGLDLLRRSEPIGIFAAARPGRFNVNDRGAGLGMELTLDSGLEAPLADCVETLAPFTPDRGPVPSLSGVDLSGRPYHLGVTFAASFVNQALYAAHRAGTLCLKLTSDDVRSLTGGAFSLNASLLALVASDLNKLADPAAPVIIELKPRNPATVELGTGEQTGVDDMGNETFDWLLKLRMLDVGVAFHVLIEDRYVRVFEVTSDVFAGLNLDVLPDNSLQVALGELRVEDFREEFNELLPNADFAQVLPALLDIALGAFLNQALVFDFDLTRSLSDALGGAPIFLRVNDIFRDGVQQDYVTLSMTFSTTTAMSFRQSVRTFAFLHPTEPGLIDRSEQGAEARPTGIVRLVVGDSLPYSAQRNLEYQVRVDDGLWTVWRPARPDGTLVTRNARLQMPGWHRLDVRSRTIGDYQSTNLTPATVPVLVDPLPPRLRARLGDTGIEVVVTDVESADPTALSLEMRAVTPADRPAETSANGGEWTPVPLMPNGRDSARQTVAYTALGESTTIEFRARDGSGNPSPILTVRVAKPDAPATAPNSGPEGAAGCRCVGEPGQGGSNALVGLLSLLGLLGLTALRRRERLSPRNDAC